MMSAPEATSSMSLTPAAAETMRGALATVVVVPVTPLIAGGNPDWAAYDSLTRRLTSPPRSMRPGTPATTAPA